MDLRYRIEGQTNLIIEKLGTADQFLHTCTIFGIDEVQVRLTVLRKSLSVEINGTRSG